MSEKRIRKRKRNEFFRKNKMLFLIILLIIIPTFFAMLFYGASFIQHSAGMIITQALNLIVGAVIEVLIVSVLFNNTRSRRKLYSLIWCKASEVTALDMLGVVRGEPRKGFHEDVYFTERVEETEFHNAIEDAFEKVAQKKVGKRGTILISMPHAGKSRMIYEWLKNRENDKVLVLKLKSVIPEIDADLNLVPYSRRNQKKVIIIDNLHTYVSNPMFNYLYKQLNRTNAVIISTSRSSLEFKKISIESEKFDYIEYLTEIHIRNLKEDKATLDKFTKFILDKLHIKLEDTSFDGNIGSTFLDLREMEKRYKQICEQMPKISHFLYAVKICYAYVLYYGENEFLIDDIKKVFYEFYPNITKGEFDSIIRKLVEQELIYKIRNNYLVIEHVYIEKIFNNDLNVVTIIVREFDMLVSRFANDVKILNGIATHIMGSSDCLPHEFQPLDKAIRCFEHMLNINSNMPMIQLNLGVAYSQRRNTKLGIEAFKKALDLRPGYIEALYNLGVIYIASHDFNQALYYFKQLKEKHPDNPWGYYYCAFIYSIQDRQEEALYNLRRTLELDPSYNQYADGSAFNNIRETDEFKSLMNLG